MKHGLGASCYAFPICVSSVLICGSVLFSLHSPAAAGESARPTPQQVEFFESRIRPILAEHCWACHGPKKQSGGIRLDARKSILEESEHGPVVVPGAPEKSALVKAIRHTGEIRMPPKQKLPAAAIDALTAWIKMGAPWPDAKTTASADDAWKKHWAFQAIRNPAAPFVKDQRWPQTSIDAYILAELEKKGLRPDRKSVV